jgi:hypothetical protein
MNRYRFDRTANAAALLRELAAAGIAAGAVLPATGSTEVDLDPADLDRAQVVVAAHDKAAADAADAQDRTRRQQARQAIVGYPDLAAPSNAQTVAVVKALCLAVAELYRTA